MKKYCMLAVIVAVVFAVILKSYPASAGEPLLSIKRLSVAAGVEKEVLLSSQDSNASWFAVLPVAYNVLSPPTGQSGVRLSLIARPSQAFDKAARTELFLGARVTLIKGSAQ